MAVRSTRKGSKPVTLGARQKAIRQVRETLSLALIYTQPGMRDLKRSDEMLTYAAMELQNLCMAIDATERKET
jgi:hypothetical protein